jgi:hypothetical protein
MRGSRAGVLAAVVGGAVAVSAGAAVAGPVPRPPAARQAAAHKQAGRGEHVHHRPRPRTVLRCQSDDTDQIDEFGDDGDEPRHSFTPTEPGGGRCSGDALGIARILAGEHPRSRAARPVR